MNKSSFYQPILFLLIFLGICAKSYGYGEQNLLIGTNVEATLTFSSGGTYEWAWDSSNDRLQSTNKSIASSTSITTITISTKENCTLSFDYSVSSESSYDKLTITLDGTVIVNAISGKVANTYKASILAGTHNLKLSYSKDSSQDSNDDRAYISNLICAKFSGTTGDLIWDVSGETLTISGSGKMESSYSMYSDYYKSTAPWRCFSDIITNLIISNECQNIPSFAFYGMKKITSVTIPSSVKSIDIGAFEDCDALSTVIFEDGPNDLSVDDWYDGCYDADSYCYNYTFTGPIKYMYIGRNVTYGFSSFYLDRYLEKIEFGKNVTNISLLKRIHSPSCNIVIDNGNPNFTISSNIIYNNDKTVLIKVFPSKSGVIDIPNTVTTIQNSAASYNNNITSINVPKSVTLIDGWAFANCINLKNVNINEADLQIGNGAFQNCTNLKSVNINNANIKSIGDYAFYEIIEDNYNDSYDYNAIPGLVFNYSNFTTYIQNIVTPNYAGTQINGKDTKDISGTLIIPEDVKNIGNYKFANWKSITSITIPSSVTKIGNSAFSGCTGLTSVNIPSSVTSLGGYTFRGCTGLTSVNIPSSITSLGDYTFNGCTGLTSVNIPSSITSLGDYTFSGCTELTSVDIPSSVTKIGNSAFEGCTKLTSVIIPSSVTNIGSYTFEGCTSLQKATINNNIIGYSQFRNCTGLTQVDICSDIKSIGEYAFYYTNKIKAFICRSAVPPSLSRNNNFNSSTRFYVPFNSINSYKTAWTAINTSQYDFLPILDIMFFDKTNAADFTNGLKGKNKAFITSVAFYDGGIDDDLTEEVMKEGMNPNCLYYVPSNAKVSGDNIIDINTFEADKIVLTDNYTYDCPIPFHTNYIEYIHTPSVWATGTSGWETITLPFAPSVYMASQKGYISPIMLGSAGNFWLRRYVGSSSDAVFFASTVDGVMEANTPYLIAFPGKTMGRGHLEGQTITFKGTDTDIAITSQPTIQKNAFIFTGNYDERPDGVIGWALNAAGDRFVKSDIVGDRPFSAYFKTDEEDEPGIKMLRIDFSTYNETTSINDLYSDDITFNILGKGSININSASDRHLNIYHIDGRLAKRIIAKAGANRVDGLDAGIYVINNQKIIVR